MKLSEAVLESLNDIDPVYLEKSEKEYGWVHRYRKAGAILFSAAAAFLLYVAVTPKPTTYDTGGAVNEAASQEMKEGAAYDSYSSIEADSGEAPMEEVREAERQVYVITLQDRNGETLSAESLQNVCDMLKEAGYEVMVDEEGRLEGTLSEAELQACLEMIPYPYQVEKQ